MHGGLRQRIGERADLSLGLYFQRLSNREPQILIRGIGTLGPMVLLVGLRRLLEINDQTEKSTPGFLALPRCGEGSGENPTAAAFMPRSARPLRDAASPFWRCSSQLGRGCLPLPTRCFTAPRTCGVYPRHFGTLFRETV